MTNASDATAGFRPRCGPELPAMRVPSEDNTGTMGHEGRADGTAAGPDGAGSDGVCHLMDASRVT